MYKRTIALVMVFIFSLSVISPAYAAEITGFSEAALRVSDEFAAKYPNGAFSLSTTMVETHENSGRTVMNIIRQGGASGKAEVTVKAVDVSAKIGQDYSLSIPGLIFDKKISGDKTASTILENGQTQVLSNTSVSENVYGSTSKSVTKSTYATTEETTIGSSANSGLKAAKEKAMGIASDRTKLAAPSDEDTQQLNAANAAVEDFYANAPGTEFTLSFADGERVKKFNLDIINDIIPEAQEQLVFVITSVTGGGCAGLQKETTVNIIDDEPYEKPVIGFSSESITADGQRAIVTLTRTKGVNYYAGAHIYTIGDSAIAGTDYTELNQKVLFIPGQTELSVETPVVKNESSVDKYFYIKIEPDSGCSLSRGDTVKVQIPKKVDVKSKVSLLQAASDSDDSDKPVILGSKSETIISDYHYLGDSDLSYGYNINVENDPPDTTWYEVCIGKHKNNRQGFAITNKQFYLNGIQSVSAELELYDLGHENHFDVLLSEFIGGYGITLINGRKDNIKKHTIDLYNRDKKVLFESSLIPIKFKVENGNRDYAAMRIYHTDINYRYFEFHIVDAKNSTENTFYLDSGSYKTTESSSAGQIEFTINDVTDNNKEKMVEGFYSSSDFTLNVKTKNVKEGYHLTGLKIHKNFDLESDFYKVDMTNNSGTLTFDSDMRNKLEDYCIYKNGVNKLSIEPVFERNPVTLKLSMDDKDIGKGKILGITNLSEDGTKINAVKLRENGELDKDDKVDTVELREGDKVNITSVGYNDYTVAGYYVTLSDGKNEGPKSEAGIQDAGKYEVALKNNISLTPIFGARQLNIRRDPDNLNKFPLINGTITYGSQVKTESNHLDNISSGQIVDFVSIPPEGYTTMWANRSGDTNGNGILDKDEYINPSTGNPYKRFDYNGDSILDTEYGSAIYGDLFSYKVNEPNPLFYYYYEPLAGKTLWSGDIGGKIKTREYDIKHGYTMVRGENGDDICKTVPVEGATVRMGGTYDKNSSDAQIGYGTSTDKNGNFTFSVANVVKNGSYMVGIDYDNISYVDKIDINGYANQYIIPTFTSMKPVRIEGIPDGGKDTDVVDDSIVKIMDKKVNFVLETASLENNVKVHKVNFKIYSNNGTLLSEDTEDVNDNKAVLSVNLNNEFAPNAKLKVELIDQNGNRSREYDSGFDFIPKPRETSLLPQFAAPKDAQLPIIGSVMGALDLGLANFIHVESVQTADTYEYTLKLNVGKKFENSKELINTIDEAEKGDDKAKDKVKEINEDSEGGKTQKKDTNVKVKSTLESKLNVNVSLEMNIKCDIPKNKSADITSKETKDSGSSSSYYFGYLKFLVTLGSDDEDMVSSTTTVVLPVGLSVTIKLGLGGTVTGFIDIEPRNVSSGPMKVYADKYGNFDYTNTNNKDENFEFNAIGGLILQPVISLSVTGDYGVASVTVGGKAKFNLVFTTDNKNRGTVTLNASVNVSVLGFDIYDKSYGGDKTTYSLFDNTSKIMSDMLLSGEESEQSNFRPISRDYLKNRSGWKGDSLPKLKNGSSNVNDFREKSLLNGVYPYPDAQLMRIDGDSLLMVYVDDHEGRSEMNRAAIYYSISHDNGATFSEPVLLADDGTLDSNPRLVDLGDRILCLYSSMDGLIMDNTTMEEVLEANGLEMTFFNKNSCKFTKPADVTKYTARKDSFNEGQLLGDYYSDENGNAVYDPMTGQVLIMYTKSDYTSDADKTFNAKDLFGSYSTIAYMLYDTNTDSFLPYSEDDYPAGLTANEKAQWDKDWYGQRFLNTEINDNSLPGGVLSDPLVLDLTTSIKDGTSYIAYTVDMDGNMETIDDRDIYLRTYNFASRTFSNSMKISDIGEDSAKADGKPQLVTFNGEMYLFYTADNAIHYCDVKNFIGELSSGDGDVSNTINIALDNSEENIPNDDYKVLVGDDGKLYLIWTEETTRLAEGVKPGSQASLENEGSFMEDQIYASVYYPSTVSNSDGTGTDSAENEYAGGRWSGKVQLTEGPGSYSSISPSVMADGEIVIVAKKSEKVLSTDSEATVQIDDPNTAQLVTLTMTPAAKADMSDDAITIEPDYPLSGEIADIAATFSNKGLMPILKPVVDFYAVQGEDETLIATVSSTDTVYGGMEDTLSTGWTVPEDIKDIKISARLRNGEEGSIEAQAEKAVPYGAKLEANLCKFEFMSQNTYRTYIEVENTGNQPLSGAELVISQIDSANNTREIERISLDDFAINEVLEINEGFEIAKKYLENESAQIEVQIQKDGGTLLKKTGTVERDLGELSEGYLDKVEGIKLSDAVLNVNKGSKVAVTVSIYSAEAAEKNHVEYMSSNPEVAAVDVEGNITGISVGDAVITAYVVPNVSVKSLTVDGHSVEGDIMEYLTLDDSKSASISVEVNKKSSNKANTASDTSKDTSSDTQTTDTQTGTCDINSEMDTPVSITQNGITFEIENEVIKKILNDNGEKSGTFSMLVDKLESSGNMQMYEISLKFNDTPVTKLENSKVKVSLPYTLKDNENSNALVVYSTTDKGELRTVPDGRYEDGKMVFKLSELRKFGVGYNYKEFEDVDESSWYADAVTFLAARGIVDGIGGKHFAPDKQMTREEFAKFISKAFRYSWSGKDIGFMDVEHGSWYEEYIGALSEAGIINGIGNGEFGTGEYITRQDMMKILYSVLQQKGIILSKTKEYKDFDDVNDIADYATPAIKALYEAGIIDGVGDNKLAPADNAPRSNMAAILMKALLLD